MKIHTQTHYFLHLTRVLLIGLAIITVGFVRSDAEPLARSLHEGDESSQQVLAYASHMSTGDLFAATNTARSQNGLAPISLNAQLSTAAQLKANDMIAKNYWSHIGPDGTQPWHWFQEAGYSYRSAGENLAYGFNTGGEVVSAWMNSPGHRANILGSYSDVGFGYASGENYQGGRNTVVVGHYGIPAAVAAPVSPTPTSPRPTPSIPLPAPAPSAPSVAATPEAPSQQNNSETGAPTPATPVTPASPSQPQRNEDSPLSTSESSQDTPAITTQHKAVDTPEKASAVTVAGQLFKGSLPSIVIGGLIILSLIAASFIATHLALFRHTLAVGEQYVMHHPAMDITLLAVMALLILTTQIGRIG